MKNIQIRRNTRVSAAKLIIGAVAVALPTLGLTGRTAAAPAPASEPLPVVGVVAPAVATVADAVVSVFDAASWTDEMLAGVDRSVFERALRAAESAIARGAAQAETTLTVIDFSRPSTEKRMWVYDLGTRELLFQEHVAHGRNSGHNLANAFSNIPESNQSSLGLYRAAESYIGKHGYSLRLDGLEKGINDRARERAIVIHGAEYVNGATAQAQGRLGRSLGCPAVRPEISRSLIDAVKDGGLLFAYYPDQNWLAESTFLN